MDNKRDGAAQLTTSIVALRVSYRNNVLVLVVTPRAYNECCNCENDSSFRIFPGIPGLAVFQAVATASCKCLLCRNWAGAVDGFNAELALSRIIYSSQISRIFVCKNSVQ